MATWYILKHLLGKPNYTAHLDPECSHLKLKHKPRHLTFVVRTRLGVHMPCKRCGGKAREEWDQAWNDYFFQRITYQEMKSRRSKIRERRD